MGRSSAIEQVPYDADGDLLHYVEEWRSHLPDQVRWRPNDPFDAVLQFEGGERGRSAAVFRWRDVDTGVRYPMFMTDLTDLLREATLTAGRTTRLRWAVRKRGQNYGLALAAPRASGPGHLSGGG